MKINWCRFGLHNYVCTFAGVFKSTHKCKNCGKESTWGGSVDNNPRGR